MCIAIRRLPEYDLTVFELRGVITGPQLLDIMDKLQAGDGTRRWLNYIAQDADLSQLDLMSLTGLKRLIGRKVSEAGLDVGFRSVFVCAAPCNEPVVQLWANYLGRDGGYPAKPEVFSSLEAAFDGLELPPAAREAVSLALGHQQVEASIKNPRAG